MKGPGSHTIAVMRHLGYSYYPNASTRPHCNGCGPFRSAFLRTDRDPTAHGGHICSGCDDENEG